jgi:hypothetical protein
MQIPFLKTDKAKKLQRDLDAARERRSKLGARLDAAESLLSAARGEPTKLARDGAADAALDAAEAKVKAAESRVSTLLSAISDEDGHIAELERQLADLADRALRAETADRCDALSVEMEQFEKKIQVLDELAKLADVVAPIVTDARGIGHFARTAHVELIPALQLLSSLLNSHARAVRSGVAPATLPTPAPVTVPLPPVPEMEAIWLMQPVAFSENGQIVIRDLNQYVRLPPALVTKAVEVGAGARIGDPRAGKRMTSWRQWHGGGLPALDHCQHLDAEAETAAAKEKQKTLPESEVVRHSAHSLFEPVDRGKPFIVKTAPGNATPGEGEAA